jgi:hypothetical protein
VERLGRVIDRLAFWLAAALIGLTGAAIFDLALHEYDTPTYHQEHQ